jgi:hypothetical protein
MKTIMTEHGIETNLHSIILEEIHKGSTLVPEKEDAAL